MTALAPGSTIGILGGGQLGRMLSQAAAKLGFDVCIFTDEPDSPASRVSAKTIVGNYLDRAALADFTRRVQVVTTEFENVPAETADGKQWTIDCYRWNRCVDARTVGKTGVHQR